MATSIFFNIYLVSFPPVVWVYDYDVAKCGVLSCWRSDERAGRTFCVLLLMYSAPLRATRGHTQADTEDAKLWPAKEGEGE